MRHVLKLTAAIFVLIVSGCGSPTSDIVGLWDADDGSQMEFLPNNTVIIKIGADRITGKYEILDEERISVTTTINFTTVTMIGTAHKGKVDGKSLNLLTMNFQGDTQDFAYQGQNKHIK